MEYDSGKNHENIKKHGISFDSIDYFEWEDCVTVVDNRIEYGEERFVSLGFVDRRIHVLVWTVRDNNIRPISFRKANKREIKRYEKEVKKSKKN